MSSSDLGFSPEPFRRRRERILEALGRGALLLPAAPVLHRSRDTEHRYRPDSELYYVTGCTEPGAVALLRGGGVEEALVLFVPERDPKAERWSGTRLGTGGAREKLQADVVYPVSALEDRLPELLRETTRIHFRLGSNERLQRLVEEALRDARVRGPRRGTGPRGVLDPGQILDELRLRKDPEEVAVIRRATAVTVSGFRETLPRVRAGMGEWEVEALLDGAFRRRGATGPAFPTIVGAGANAYVLHYGANASLLEAGALVILDGGAEVGLYAGDVTRTVPADGRFTPEQRAVYDVVLQARKAALEAVGPGRPVDGIHQAVLLAITSGLRELGVLSGGIEELLESKAYEPWFPHQTSHWLGLDVHDPGDYAREGKSRPLEPGMVLAVEPGLYFAPEGGEGWERFRGIGVRIEDDVLVTGEGRENLTGSLPVTPEGLEELMGSSHER